MFYLCCFFLFTYNSVISKIGTAYLSEALDFIYCFKIQIKYNKSLKITKIYIEEG
jgi:hypothetical protein